MPKRLAITVAGAVSLGSYEAGVLYEVLEALRQHNTDQDTRDDDKIIVDVLTGASAGGMTATIAAQKLLFDADALLGEKTNAFYLPWVVDVSLEELLRLRAKDNLTHSILSSELVRKIADEHLLSRYKGSKKPTAKRHPAADEKISLGLALSNLNGIDYRRPLETHQLAFTYTRYQEEYAAIFDAKNPEHDTRDTWRFPCDAAISTGAFPFAFSLVPLTRTREELVEMDPSSEEYLCKWPSATGTFAYTDGGTFQNEPLGLAKDLVDKIDGHQDTDSRFYLFISPGERVGTSDRRFKALDPQIPKVIGHLVGAIFHQARFHDWIRAEAVNDHVRVLDSRALDLKDLIINGRINPERDLRPAAEALLPILLDTRKPGNKLENRQQAEQRLRNEYAKEFDEIVRQRPGANDPASNAMIWIDSILTLETAAYLGARDEMVIYGITASENELASGPLCAFGGFFDREFREHDYALGRNKARQFLRDLNNPALRWGIRTFYLKSKIKELLARPAA
jgi:Patatin-like phospholipase